MAYRSNFSGAPPQKKKFHPGSTTGPHIYHQYNINIMSHTNITLQLKKKNVEFN